ncbi:unnamed protein product [Didymodactylos carnosus]|uniref:Hint domain-containing protein n=2 Tax=Didymodactylos carnosus TaxID=1234261 RepID=A0A813SCW8_9BILA|nr:unnamed protein product [Didymodactylos carnosus]CAF3577741.1 unnamed protein product [Didymodactylos carnosus]
MLKIVLCLLLVVSSVYSECRVEENPKGVIRCLSNIAAAFEALFTKNIQTLCNTGAAIAECVKPHMYGCVAQQISEGALDQISYLAVKCCPNKDGVLLDGCWIKELQTGVQKCFSLDSKVLLANGQEKLISQLKQGDAVYAFDDTNQNVITTEIIGMLDNEPEKFGLLKLLTTSSGRQLSLSSSHLIPTKSDGYLMAKNLQLDMKIYVVTSDKQLTVETIVNITDIWKQGYAAPLTQSGTIIVNNVAASCYATIKSHQLAHAVLAPMRWWYSLSKNTISDAYSIQNGVHWFPKTLFKIASFLLPSIIN